MIVSFTFVRIEYLKKIVLKFKTLLLLFSFHTLIIQGKKVL